MILDATPGSPTANAYVTVDDATFLLGGRLYTQAWFGTGEGTSAQAQSMATLATGLMWATQLLDTHVRWYGKPTTTTQALAWPRTGQVDHLGRPMASTSVPAVIQRATAYLALALLGTPEGTGQAAGAPGIKSQKLGDTTIVYQDQPSTPVTSPTQSIPAEVRAMLRPYGTMAGSLTVPLLRV